MRGFILLSLGVFFGVCSALKVSHSAIHPRDLEIQHGWSIEGRITNGNQASEGQVPYIVGVSLNSNGNWWWCGGSIIGHTWVLTAAHCTAG